ncbi:MAG: NAD-dependent epimerase/dehydratase family protein [Calditrichaeota bacterium]|nr:NAD-dependent epimerase/dehydratase family protein [Calditrichota bacterium]
MKRIRAIITGTTGMVGKGVLLECLENDDVESVIIINRRSIGIDHRKCQEIIHPDLSDISALSEKLKDSNACYFCAGVSSVGMSEADYRQVTYDLTLSFAKTLAELNPDLHFCYVSGTGTDSTESGRQMWARVKGKTENDLLKLFPNSTMFRPGFIQPSRGEKAKSSLVNFLYVLFKPLYPVLKVLFPKIVTSTSEIGKAMIYVSLHGSEKRHLESNDINALA